MQTETGTSLTSPASPPPAETPDREPATARAVGRSRLYAVLFVCALLTLAADQGSKIWALRALDPGVPRPLIGDWIRLNLIWNSGAAFSLGHKATWLLTIISIVIVAVVAVSARKVSATPWAVTFGLLLGGAIGNLIDRVFRDPGWFQGHVVDFIDYFGFFIGNVADIAIVVAAGMVVWLTLRGERP